LGQDTCALLHDLVGDVGAMSAASGRANVVDEADLLERARVGETDADLPARVDLVVEFDLLRRLALLFWKIQIYVILKTLDFAQFLPIQINGHALG